MDSRMVCWWFDCGPPDAADLVAPASPSYAPRIAVLAPFPSPDAPARRAGPSVVFAAVPDDLAGDP